MSWSITDYLFSGNVLSGQSIFNVEQFGAKGDGIADDTIPIQNAVTACLAAGGGVVYFPTDVYLMSTTVQLPPGNANITFAGDGWGSVIKQYGTAFARFGFFTGTNVNNVNFVNLQFQGNNVFDPIGTAANVQALGGSWITSTNIYYSYCRFYQTQGFALSFDGTSCTDIGIDHCEFDTSGQNRPTALFMPQVFFGSGANFSLRASVTNCIFKNLHFHGIWLQANNSIVDGCLFDNVGETRVVLGSKCTVSNCVDTNGWMAVESGQFIESFSDDVVITGNSVYNAGQTNDPYNTGNGNCLGIAQNGGRAVVSNNRVVNCKAGGILITSTTLDPSGLTGNGLVVTNNLCVNNGTMAFTTGGIGLTQVGGGAFTNMTVTGNVAYGNLPYDMSIGNAYDPLSCTFSANSPWPDRQTTNPPTLTNTTAPALMSTLPVKGWSMGSTGGFRALLRGVFWSTAGTCKIVVGFGGSSMITLGGTWLAGNTITYTLNGHNTVYTVGASPTLATVAAGLVAAIAADGTTGPLVTPSVAAKQAYGTAVLITAKPAAFILGTTLGNSISKTSAAGTVTMHAAALVEPLLNTTISGTGTLTPFKGEFTVANGNEYSQVHAADLTFGTTVAANQASAVQIDTTIDQSLAYYVTLNTLADQVVYNSLQYERT